MPENVADAFGRSLSGSLGNADSGQAWSYTGTAGSVAVDGSKVVLTPSGGETNTALIESGIAHVDVQCDFSVSSEALGDPLIDSATFSLLAATQDTGSYYVARWSSIPGQPPTIAVGVRHGDTGTLTLFGNAQPWPGGLAPSDTLAPSTTLAPADIWSPGEVWTMKLHLRGGDVFARAWLAGTAEPVAWQAVGVEAVRTYPAGGVGFRQFTSAGLTNDPVFTIDNFSATVLTPPPIPNPEGPTRQRILLGMRPIPGDNPATAPRPETNYDASIGARETLLGRKLDVVLTFRDWNLAGQDMSAEQRLIANGQIPMLSWPLGANTPSDALTGTVSGTYDSIINAWAAWAAAQPGTIWFRFAWEMNIDPIWGADPVAFVQAWQRIYNLFATAGADNVKFLWAPNHRTELSTNELWDTYYPGDAYVHLIGLDAYNKNPSSQFFADLITSGDFVQQTANHNWYLTYRQRRRGDGTVIDLVLAETGSREQIDPHNTNPQPMTKDAWIADLQTSVRNYPSIAAVVYFDVNAPNGDYRIDTTPAGGVDSTISNPTLAAFLRLSGDPYWGGTVGPPPPPPPPPRPVLDVNRKLGAGGYQVFLYTRGQRSVIAEVRSWTQLSYDVRRSDIGQATISFANIGSDSEQGAHCRSIFRDTQSWVHEVVIVRPDGFVWSGPVIARAYQGGTATITAAQISQWGLMRVIHRTHKITTGDATDAYAALWHDAVDPDNSMRWQLVTTAPFGDTIPVAVKNTDRTPFATAVQPLSEAGIDTVTVDRVTFMGPPDTIKLPIMLTDNHLMTVPDFTEDGTQQANVYGVTGATSGSDKPVYGEAQNGLADEHGLLEVIVQSSTATTNAQAEREARQGIATKGDARPVLSQITLNRNAPFTIPMLQPGRLWDVRLGLTPVAISDTYRISRVGVTADASQSGEVIQIDVDQSNVAT